jgi:hypothetical protein
LEIPADLREILEKAATKIKEKQKAQIYENNALGASFDSRMGPDSIIFEKEGSIKHKKT